MSREPGCRLGQPIALERLAFHERAARRQPSRLLRPFSGLLSGRLVFWRWCGFGDVPVSASSVLREWAAVYGPGTSVVRRRRKPRVLEGKGEGIVMVTVSVPSPLGLTEVVPLVSGDHASALVEVSMVNWTSRR